MGWILVAASTVAVAGCGGGGPQRDATPTPAATNAVGTATATPGPVKSRRLRVRTDGLDGSYITPKDGTPGRPVLALGGSEGEPPLRLARALAAEGHPTLALDYFGGPGLPKRLRDVPLEYIRSGGRWLRERTGARPALEGGSRGGELALLVAATWPRDFTAVAAYVPSAYVEGANPPPGSAWTLRGRRLPHVPLDQFRAVPPTPDVARRTAIRIDRFPGPVLLVGAGDDLIWPSGPFVEVLAKTLQRRRRGTTLTRVYPLAGHRVGGAVPVPFAPISESTGGTPEEDLKGRRDSWPLLLRLLR